MALEDSMPAFQASVYADALVGGNNFDLVDFAPHEILRRFHRNWQEKYPERRSLQDPVFVICIAGSGVNKARGMWRVHNLSTVINGRRLYYWSTYDRKSARQSFESLVLNENLTVWMFKYNPNYEYQWHQRT